MKGLENRFARSSGRKNAPQNVRSCSTRWLRKDRQTRYHSHVAAVLSPRKNPQTCFEGPFGEVVRATGPMAKANPFRLSTVYQDDEPDLLRYVHRPYSASQGRFLSQDPLGELGFEAVQHRRTKPSRRAVNPHTEDGSAYCFVRNSPPNDIDIYGLCDCKCGRDATAAMDATHADITKAFNGASWLRKRTACSHIFSPYGLWDWDILWLKGAPLNPGCSDCQRTVTYRGVCVNPDELNYMMFGWAMTLCDKDEGWLDALRSGLEHRGHDSLDAVMRKVAAAAYGYDDGSKWQLQAIKWPKDCTPDSTPWTPKLLGWYWRGMGTHN